MKRICIPVNKRRELFKVFHTEVTSENFIRARGQEGRKEGHPRV
jgi:hypothetical protein